jgi:hypothetical protein
LTRATNSIRPSHHQAATHRERWHPQLLLLPPLQLAAPELLLRVLRPLLLHPAQRAGDVSLQRLQLALAVLHQGMHIAAHCLQRLLHGPKRVLLMAIWVCCRPHGAADG